jgi:hypothetical protein
MDFEQAVGHELEWRQPDACRRVHQLTLDGREVGSLRFETSLGSRATGECGPSKWTFKRTGFLSPRVSVREAGSDSDIAIFTPSWTGSGWVAFSAGRRYHLRPTNFWATEWAFETADGTPAIIVRGPHGLFKQGGYATVAQTVAGLPEAPVLLLLIWYLRVLMNEDASAVAATVVACS